MPSGITLAGSPQSSTGLSGESHWGRWGAPGSLVLLWALVWLPRLASPAIFDDSDAMYAEVPREMLRRGDWITPYANHLRYLEKPPLYYWLVATCYRLFGVSTVSARLDGALVCLALVLTCYFLGELLCDAWAGWIAGAALATCAGFYIFTQQLMPDPLFTLLLSLAYLCFLHGRGVGRDPKQHGSTEDTEGHGDCWHLGMFALLGLAVLTKGLIGIVFPVLTLGAYGLLRRPAGQPLRLPLGRGLLLFALVAAPWHLLVGWRNPGWAWFYFVNEHLLRFLNRRVPRDYGTMPLAAFWLLHVAWLFPWSVFLPSVFGLRSSVFGSLGSEHRTPNTEHRTSDALLFPALWAGAVLLFFSFSTRLEYYSMPALPALALLIGVTGSRLIRRESEQPPPRSLLVSLDLLALVTGAMLLAGIGLALWAARTPAGPVRPLTNPSDPYSVFLLSPLAHMSLEQLRRLVGPALGVGLSAFVGAAAARAAARRGRVGWMAALLAVAMVPCLFSLHRCAGAFEDDLSSRRLAAIVAREWRPGDRIVVDGLYETYNSLGFYTGQPLYVLDARRGYLEYGSRYSDAPPLFLDRLAFLHLLQDPGAGRFFLVTRVPNRFQHSGSRAVLLADVGGKSLLLLGESPQPLAMRRSPSALPFP
jgi:4-amino-4-deoxy-L-arabinose transferase-like glycosyltransferase